MKTHSYGSNSRGKTTKIVIFGLIGFAILLLLVSQTRLDEDEQGYTQDTLIDDFKGSFEKDPQTTETDMIEADEVTEENKSPQDSDLSYIDKPPPPPTHLPNTQKPRPDTPSSSNKGLYKNLQDTYILVLTYNRPDLLMRTLDTLVALPGVTELKGILVSQDGSGAGIAEAVVPFVEKYSSTHPGFFTHKEWDRAIGLVSTQNVARHYKNAFNYVFGELGAGSAIVLEDDMLVSPDFLAFFDSTVPLLSRDPTLWCVSSWNDNGFDYLELDPKRLFRTSYFPGLGWLLTSKLWLEELAPKWPEDHWDHFMRVSTVSKDRDCVVPEVSRNYNVGQTGATMSAADYARLLQSIKHNTDPKVTLGDVSYVLEENYARYLRQLVSKAIPLEDIDLDALPPGDAPLLIPYRREQFRAVASMFGLWDVPRAHHKQTQIVKTNRRVFILADRRLSPYLIGTPFGESRNPDVAIVAGETGQSCLEVCVQSGGRTCEASHFDFLNSCDILSEHFPCEAGCGKDWGTDIPNYVAFSGDRNYRKCLITETIADCAGMHPHTARLCPCL